MSDPASSQTRGFLIDLDGVIYEDEDCIAGAAETIAWVRKQQIPHLFLTNTTSRSRSALVEKLDGMGIRASESRIVTPPFAANRWLQDNVGGLVALFVDERAVGEFTDVEIVDPAGTDPVSAVVLGDYSDRWTFGELNRAFRLLMSESHPKFIALGMTRYWHAADGLRLDTAPFVVALRHASGIEPIVVGKPARPFFDMALAELGTPVADTWMIGDDIRGDIGGAQQAGLRAALVQTGKYRHGDLEGDIQPDAVLRSIADLPAWWEDLSVSG